MLKRLDDLQSALDRLIPRVSDLEAASSAPSSGASKPLIDPSPPVQRPLKLNPSIYPMNKNASGFTQQLQERLGLIQPKIVLVTYWSNGGRMDYDPEVVDAIKEYAEYGKWVTLVTFRPSAELLSIPDNIQRYVTYHASFRTDDTWMKVADSPENKEVWKKLLDVTEIKGGTR